MAGLMRFPSFNTTSFMAIYYTIYLVQSTIYSSIYFGGEKIRIYSFYI